MNLQHFNELRDRINSRLIQLATPYHELQINEYTWLYGALGSVPSDVMSNMRLPLQNFFGPCPGNIHVNA